MIIDYSIHLFAENMQKELNANDHKGNWKDFKDRKIIMAELEHHLCKLYNALNENNNEKMKEYIADCANNLLFLRNTIETK